jgi:uncharacterized membrane protein
MTVDRPSQAAGLSAPHQGAGASTRHAASMRAIRRLCGPGFVLAGTLHFVAPSVYKPMVPPWLPARRALVFVSGAAEITGGVGLMNSATRRLGGWWLIATLIAIFPANVHMATHSNEYPTFPGGARALWARLPFQAMFIAWVYEAMQADEAPATSRDR